MKPLRIVKTASLIAVSILAPLWFVGQAVNLKDKDEKLDSVKTKTIEKEALLRLKDTVIERNRLEMAKLNSRIQSLEVNLQNNKGTPLILPKPDNVGMINAIKDLLDHQNNGSPSKPVANKNKNYKVFVYETETVYSTQVNTNDKCFSSIQLKELNLYVQLNQYDIYRQSTLQYTLAAKDCKIDNTVHEVLIQNKGTNNNSIPPAAALAAGTFNKSNHNYVITFDANDKLSKIIFEGDLYGDEIIGVLSFTLNKKFDRVSPNASLTNMEIIDGEVTIHCNATLKSY